MKSGLVIASAAAMAVIGGFTVQPVKPIVNPQVRPAGLEAQETSASATLFGQFRTSLASWLYLRADLYVHNGVEMRPLTHDEFAAGQRGVGSADNLLKEDLTNITVVPDRRHDFRGIVGDVERETATFKSMIGHTHQSPIQAMPLYRLMTVADPQFIQAWTTGASIIFADKTDAATKKSLDFLLQGLRENPRSVEILTEIGMTFAAGRKDFKSALAYLEEGRNVARKLEHPSESELEGIEQGYRWLALCYKEAGTDFDRLYAAREGLARFPDDPVLQRLGK